MNTLFRLEYRPNGLRQAVQSYLHHLGLKIGGLIVLYFLGRLLFSLMGIPAAWIEFLGKDGLPAWEQIAVAMRDFSLIGGGIALTLGIFSLGQSSFLGIVRHSLKNLFWVLFAALILTGCFGLAQVLNVGVIDPPLLGLLIASGLGLLVLAGCSLQDGFQLLRREKGK
ncbi:MAG: hypothetical protein HC904_15270 [Blastochloris sp.]|nr:hypothetical protein [Blastochloris sp.]